MDCEETVLLNTRTSPNFRHPRDRRGPSISRACGNLENLFRNRSLLLKLLLDPGIRQDSWIPTYRGDDANIGMRTMLYPFLSLSSLLA
jgi:hypothetical protein